jgi:predicted NodU family carbamoyl transferase
MIGWTLDELQVASTLRSESSIDRGRIVFPDHYLSHAASAFPCPPFSEAAVLIVDGVDK